MRYLEHVRKLEFLYRGKHRFFHAYQTGTHPNERRHPFPLYRSPSFFTPSKLEHTPMKEGTPYSYIEAPVFSRLPNWNTSQWKRAPLPPLTKPPFFYFFQNTFQWKRALLSPVQEFKFSHVFQAETHPKGRRHPFPLYRSHRFFTPSKLEHTPMNEGTPTPYTKAPVFSLSNKEGTPSPYTGILVFSRVPNTYLSLCFVYCHSKC